MITLAGMDTVYAVGDTMIVDASKSTFSEEYPFGSLIVIKTNPPKDTIVSTELNTYWIFHEPGLYHFSIIVRERPPREWGSNQVNHKVTVQ